MADADSFGEAFDRAAEADAGLRRRRGLQQGERATGAEIVRRLDRLDSTERRDPALDELAAEAVRGDAAARERLVSGLLPFVRRTARRYAGPDLDEADLIQDGVLGVLRALQRYDPERGVPFTAYAGWWIRQAMQQAVAEQSRAVRLPTHVLWDIHDLRDARRDPANRGASDRQIALRLGWSDGRAADVLRAERPAMSLDAPHADDEGRVSPLGDLLADPLSEEAYEDVLGTLTGGSLRALLTTLTDREREVVAWRFGLDGEPESLRQIGRRLGMSAERVRQIESRAVVKLRTAALGGTAGT